ncbi:divisome protein SepX/GlpR [Nocardia mikamii]|uniref:divisome protein SepX/GlpR n=1 Tax=Nocardia mikamii TaxID=508464 RepID=UPI0007A39CDF|nr:gephyrin-like molybdotransferase receptor GlpR [Nocardia mikamii]
MPNSILWIALVVLWVFVLFPMLAGRHPRIRRTTDVALATRVLHRGGTRRRAKKGPATGHETDPDWVPAPRQKRLSHGDDAEDRMTTSADEPVIEDDRNAPERAESEVTRARRSAGDPPGRADAGEEHTPETPVDADAEPGGDERDDVDGAAGGEGDGDLAGAAHTGGPDDADDREQADEVPAAAETEDRPQASMARIPPAPSAAVPARRGDVDADDDLDDSDYLDDPDHLDDSDDLDDRAGGEPASGARDFVPSRRGRGGFDPEADAIARAARYRFRQRTALGLILSTLLFGAFAIVVSATLWWGCALSVVAFGAYLAYLRRQVRFEEDIRRRRAARLPGARQRPAGKAEPVAQDQVRAERRPGMDRDAARALRRRAVVLDVDDEDPLFDHLEHFDAAAARATRNRAAGGEIRRAAGE